MKKLLTFGLILLTTTLLSQTNNISLDGNWAYDINIEQQTIRIVGDKISSNLEDGEESGTIKLAFYLTYIKYDGISIVGYDLADYQLDNLSYGYVYNNIDRILYFNGTPPYGSFYLTLLLLEYIDNQFVIVDYLNFDGYLSFNIPSYNIRTNESYVEEVDCSSCNGTGKSLTKDYPPQFGLGPTYSNDRCDICGSYESHSHHMCPVCRGKGKIQKIKY